MNAYIPGWYDKKGWRDGDDRPLVYESCCKLVSAIITHAWEDALEGERKAIKFFLSDDFEHWAHSINLDPDAVREALAIEIVA